MIIATFFFSSTTQCRIIKAFLVHNVDVLMYTLLHIEMIKRLI